MKNSKFIMDKAASALCLIALVFFLSGCLDKDDNNNIQPVPVGYVSIYHAAPDAPLLDISVDNNRINNQPLGYADHSGYLNFRTGNRNIKFSTVNAASALIDTTFDVSEGKAYSVFVINRLSHLETLVVQDSAAVPATGKAMIRFVQLSPDAPAMEIGISGNNTAALFGSTNFKNATEFKEINANNYSFEIKAAGSSNVLVSAKNISIQPGGYYTIVTRGFVNPPTGNTNVLSVEVL
jgi:hypothetical protein